MLYGMNTKARIRDTRRGRMVGDEYVQYTMRPYNFRGRDKFGFHSQSVDFNCDSENDILEGIL